MSPTLTGFMEDLVLDPAKYREFTTNPANLLAESGLTEEERQAIASGEVSTVSQILDGGNNQYINGAAVTITVNFFAPNTDD